MRKLRFKKALKRLRYLPWGFDFFRYSSNKSVHLFNRVRKSTKVAHAASLMIEVTNLCNIKCTTCARQYQYGQQMDTGHMDIKQLKKVVDEVYPWIDSIYLTGLGEPLLYKNLTEAVAYIKNKNKGIVVSISTNAYVPDCVGKIEILAPHLDSVQISIDGTGRTYNQIRQGADYEVLIATIDKLTGRLEGTGTLLSFNSVILKDNFRQMAELIHLAHKLGIPFLNFSLFNIATVTDKDASYYDFFQQDEFKQELQKAIYTAKEHKKINVTWWDYKSPNGFKRCRFPWSAFYITWDGYLVPCCAKPFPKELNFGNVFEKGMMACLNSGSFQDFRKKWYANETPGFCRKCHMVDLKPIQLNPYGYY